MSSYKLVKSKEVQEKAERLGCERKLAVTYHNTFMYVIVDDKTKDDNIYWFSSEFNESHPRYQEITQADFLALPEPLKVGDWVKGNNCKETTDSFFIFKIIRIEDGIYYGSSFGLGITMITKLTQEQIDVLGLE